MDNRPTCPFHCEMSEKIDSALELKQVVNNLQSIVGILQETTITQKAFYEQLTALKEDISVNRDTIRDAKSNYWLLIVVIAIALSTLGLNIFSTLWGI